MTIETTGTRISYTGNGSTTVFAFPFKVPEQQYLVVSKVLIADGTTTVISDSDYTVTGIDNPSGGSVTYPLVGSPLSSSYYLTIRREVPFDQPTDLVNQSSLYADVLEGAYDYLEMQIQQMNTDLDRKLTLRPQDNDGEGWYDANGNGIRNLHDPEEAQDAATKAYVDSRTVAAGNVPSPVLGEVGYYLKATGTGTWGWQPVSVTITPGSITTTELADNAVTNAKMADNSVGAAEIIDGSVGTAELAAASVTIAKINATGTPSSTTFLRGDGTWAVPAAGGGGSGTVTAIGAAGGITTGIGIITTAGTLTLNTNNFGGIGAFSLMCSSILTVAANAAVDSTAYGLQYASVAGGGTYVPAGQIWRNMSDAVAAGVVGLFQRVS